MAKANTNPVNELEPRNPLVKLPDVTTLWSDYQASNSVHRVGSKFGVSGDRIHRLLTKAGYKLNRSRWTEEEVSAVVEYYKSTPPGKFLVSDLASRLNRTTCAVSLKASELGLGQFGRPGCESTLEVRSKIQAERFCGDKGIELRRIQSERTKKWIAENGHPRGATGMKHTEGAKSKMREALFNARKDPDNYLNSEAYRQSLSDRFSKEAGNRKAERCHSNGKAGFRDDVGVYVRSCWEANYARHLNFLIKAGEIQAWEYEPQTFWFLEIKRGTRSYKPDFRVTLKDGSIEYHEVKGWMTQRSRTALKRMGIYYPEIKMVLIERKRYQEIAKTMSKIIPNWE